MGNNKQTPKGKIVTDFLEANPTMPTLTMAKLIYQKYPLDFDSIESIRTLIRSYRGALGVKHREHNYGDKKFYNQDYKLKLPEPESVDFVPYKLPLINNNIGIISDQHIPNHRNTPIEVAYEYFKEQKVNTIILNGDILDNTPFTRHEGKRPSAGDVRRWFDQAEYYFEYTREEFPDAMIIWAEGNHDFWYRRWMQQHAWQLDDDPYYSLQERLHIDEYKIKFIPQQQYLMAGKLAIFHGHQISGRWGVGVMPARTLFNKAKKSALIGHVHVSDTYTDNDLHKEIITCWTTGCTCTLTPEYNPIGGKACHGFAHATIEKNGHYSVKNFRIDKGKIL